MKIDNFSKKDGGSHMEIIVGTIIIKDNKVLMVKEAKKECYSKWSFPAGHLEKGETLLKGAERELIEETGCKAFPVLVYNTQNMNIMMFNFLANLLENDLKYNTDEIIETKWISIDEIKKMNRQEFRSYPVLESIIECIESGKLYDLELYKNLQEI